MLRFMPLFEPDSTDWAEAHGHLEHEKLYRENLGPVKWTFSSVGGFFKQDSADVDDMAFNYIDENFGLEQDWGHLIEAVRQLNLQNKCKYKILLLARHGQGYHNVASAKHKQDWSTKWRYQETDGEITWGPDPLLTELGIKQAQANNQFLVNQVKHAHMPIPSKFYCSPLSRSISTMLIEWDTISTPRPLVVDKLREMIGVNPCHKRLTKSQILQKYPTLLFEPGFPEEDVLHAEYTEREALWQQFMRVDSFLQDLFETDDEFVSITSHSFTTRAVLTVAQHRPFTIAKGGIVPVVIRAVARNGEK